MTQSTDDKIDRDDKLPWSIIGAGLAALAALYCTRGQFNGLIAAAVLLLASGFTSWRLPVTRVISWGLRLTILIVVVSMIRDRSTVDPTVWYLNEEDTKTVGIALAAELILRAWERHAPDRVRESRGAAILMTSFVYIMATHTYERTAIQIITPIYMVFVLLALRSFARIGQPSGIAKTTRRELVLMRGMILFLSLGIALAATSLVTRYEYQLTNWASEVLIRKHTKSAEIGFSMDPQLGSVANPQPTLDRVLLIDGPPTEQHLRAMAFDTYTQHRWLPVMGDRKYQPVDLPAMKASGPSRQMTFRRVGDTANLLLVPLEMQQIAAQDSLEEDQLGTLRDHDRDDNPPYEVSVPSAPAFQGPLCAGPDAAQRQRLLAIPSEIDPKVIELAKTIAGNRNPALQIARIETTLQSQHAYSLSFEPHGEPLNDFILNNRAAHCQYFASAVVMLARAVGIPARYVSGFYAHEQYGSNEMVVRSRDAHAWAECWIDGVGWMTVDATPAGGRPDQIFQDPPAWKRWWEKLTDLPGQIQDWITAQGTRGKMLLAVVAGMTLLGYIVRQILRRRRKPKPDQTGYPQPAEELAALAKRFEKWLRQRNLQCPPQLTWADHLSSAPMPGDSMIFLRMYDQARFGGDQGSISKAEKFLQELEVRPG